MAAALKTLGQSAPAATTLTALYTVPASTSAMVGAVVVCNRGDSVQTYRISVAVAGAADDNKQYLVRDMPIDAHDTLTPIKGLAMAATDVLRVYASSTDLSFNASGEEIT